MRDVPRLDDRRQTIDPVIVTTESQLKRLINNAVQEALERVEMVVPDAEDLVDMKGILALAGPHFTEDWMYDHAVKLGFGIKFSHKKLLFSKRKFLAYVNGQYRHKRWGGK